MKTIAIVGNSPNLLNHYYGKEIDSHNIVLRFNNFIIKGYEQYVGTKTTDIAVVSMDHLYNNLDLYITIGKNHRFYREDFKILRKDIFNKMFVGLLNPNDVIRIDFKKYHDDIREKIGTTNHYCSTGLMFLQYFSDIYPTARIDAYGFTFFKEKNIHYCEKWLNDYYHDGNSEEIYFNKYLANKINLHI